MTVIPQIKWFKVWECQKLLQFKAGVVNLLVFAYPQIIAVPLRVPPNINLIRIVPPGQKNAKKT
jgi:hypothetical protein